MKSTPGYKQASQNPKAKSGEEVSEQAMFSRKVVAPGPLRTVARRTFRSGESFFSLKSAFFMRFSRLKTLDVAQSWQAA